MFSSVSKLLTVVMMHLAVNAECVKATIEAQRVWPGKVGTRFEDYMWYLASTETPRYLEKGRSYVVVATRLEDKRAREGVGLGGSDVVAFTGVPCSDGYTAEEVIHQLGPGKPSIDVGVQGKIMR
jgi:hypothetical protein